jgi:hypothetical protein
MLSLFFIVLARYRLKINVRDENIQTVFALFDDRVKKLAFETYGVWTSIVSICIHSISFDCLIRFFRTS